MASVTRTHTVCGRTILYAAHAARGSVAFMPFDLDNEQHDHL